VAGGPSGSGPTADGALGHTAGVLAGLVWFVLAAGLALVSIGFLIAPRTRPASLAQAGAVFAVALAAGLGTLAFSSLRDDAVEVGGDTIYCQAPLFEDPLPPDVEDRCRAQRRDRADQARVASAGVVLVVAGFAALLTSVGPLTRQAAAETDEESPAALGSVASENDQ
jgi:hypothetical protein